MGINNKMGHKTFLYMCYENTDSYRKEHIYTKGLKSV